MADTKISGLTAYTAAAATDVLPIVDVGNSITKKITARNLMTLPPGAAAAGGAPLNFTPAGANLLSSAVAGATEVDANGILYYSHAGGARGILPATQFVAIQSPFTLQNVLTVQNCLTAANDTLAVQAATTYFFQGFYTMTTGATSHTTGMAFALSNGASVINFMYYTNLWSAAANTIQTTQSTTQVSGVAAKVITAASGSVTTNIQFSGIARINASGSITPQIIFNVDPTGTCTMNIGSWIMFNPLGINTIEAVGSWS